MARELNCRSGETLLLELPELMSDNGVSVVRGADGNATFYSSCALQHFTAS